MAESAAPCRLFVYLARTAPLGIVLRRGPSAWVRLSLWHTDTDSFEHGQWMKGRVYERRCDVSPDGSLFVSFIRKEGTRSPDVEQVDSWVAISRPPWFTALALWPLGGTYCMGGFFVSSHAVYIGTMDVPQQGDLPFWLSMTTHLPYVDRTPNWTERTVYINRLLRDGWQEVGGEPAGMTWQRNHPGNHLTLVMTELSDADIRAFGGPHVVEYAVRSDRGERWPLGRATWADWDQRGRLVVAQGGRLMRWQPGHELHEILDFNPQLPEPEPAPSWAQTWPRAPMRTR